MTDAGSKMPAAQVKVRYLVHRDVCFGTMCFLVVSIGEDDRGLPRESGPSTYRLSQSKTNTMSEERRNLRSLPIASSAVVASTAKDVRAILASS